MNKQRGILEIALLGSITREDFNPQSDIDVIADFDKAPEPFALFSIARPMGDLEDLTGRKVDIIERAAFKGSQSNRHRSKHIIDSAVTVHEQRP